MHQYGLLVLTSDGKARMKENALMIVAYQRRLIQFARLVVQTEIESRQIWNGLAP
jgi:hypothetical protein